MNRARFTVAATLLGASLATGAHGLPLIGAARRQLDDAVRRLSEPAGMPAIRYEEPAGDPGIFGPDAMTWRVHRNGGTLFIGGIAAVLLELAEPRVRSGVWDYTDFRTDPVGRMQRTGMAAMVTTYGSSRDVEAVTARASVAGGGVTVRVVGCQTSGTPRARWMRAELDRNTSRVPVWMKVGGKPLVKSAKIGDRYGCARSAPLA